MITGIRIKVLFLLTGILLFTLPKVHSQDSLPLQAHREINQVRLAATIGGEAVAYGGLISYLQFIWYKDHSRVPFHFKNDNKAYLQMDKFGHVYGAYAESYIGYKLLRNAGVKKGPALVYGGTLGLVLQAPIEIFDGLYDGWGFSWGDMAANTLGAAFVIGQELLFDDQLLKYKWSYHESPYYLSATGNRVENRFKRAFFDYNAHTYWLSVPINTIMPSLKFPAWANIAAGYGANGMFGKFENVTSFNGIPIPPMDRYRKYLLSMDIDWTKIKTHSRLLKAVFNCLVFVKLPFPAIEFNSLGKVKGYWLYY